MNDTIKLKDGTIAPNTLNAGEMAIDEVNRILYLKTHRGPIPVPLDRMALEPSDENASSDVYVYRSTLIGEHVELNGGGGAQYRDDRNWRVFGLAPQAVSTAGCPNTGLFEVTYPTTLQTLRARVLSGAGTLTFAIYAWDEALGTQLLSQTVTVSASGAKKININLSLDPGRYAAVVTGDGSLVLEALTGLLPWHSTPQVHAFTMSEASL